MTDCDHDDRARSGDTDLVRRLSTLFDQRADSVVRGPVVDLTRAPSTSPWRAHRPVATGIAVAATVAAALTVVGVVADHRQSTTVAPSSTRSGPCVIASAPSFATAVPSAAGLTSGSGRASTHCPVGSSTSTALKTGAAGLRSCTTSAAKVTTLLDAHRQLVDQPINTPRAVARAGAFVMQQQRMTSSGRYTHNELAYFDATGHGTSIWIDPAPDVDQGDYDVAVDPDAAVSSDWVVFSPSYNRNKDNNVRAWNIRTHRTVTLAHQHQPAGSSLVPFAPIVIGDTVYWIEYPVRGSKDETLVGWNLSLNRVSFQSVTDVVRLVRIGNDVGLIVEKDSGGDSTSSLIGRPGHAIPAAVTQASVGLTGLTSDGTTVRWTSGKGTEPGLIHTWRTDTPTVAVRTFSTSQPNAVLTWPFVQIGTNKPQVIDLRTNTVTRLPATVSIALVTGTTVLVTKNTSAHLPNDTVSRVPLSELAAVFCH